MINFLCTKCLFSPAALPPCILCDGCLALANMDLLSHAMGLGVLYCGFASRAITGNDKLLEYFGVTEERQLRGCPITGKTDLILKLDKKV